MKLARTMETQCFASKYYGPRWKDRRTVIAGNGRWRCQYEEDHEGPHKDAFDREWENRLPVWSGTKYVKRSELK
jgi:hypothetical protein